MDVNVIIKLLIAACGVYMTYTAMQMKVSHQIPEMLVGKTFPLDRAKDQEGFMKKTFPLTMGVGLMLFVVGVIGIFQVFIAYPVVDIAIMLVLFIILIYYGKFLLKAQKKYLIGLEEEKKK